MTVKIGKYCTVGEDVEFGEDVIVWGHANLYGCRIGSGSRIGAFVEIQSGAVIGNQVRIQSHSFICSQTTIEDDVFVGHNVSFINDRHPSISKTVADTWCCEPVHVCKGASIGTGSTIMGGVRIGEGAVVGAGSTVLKDVPPHCVVAGVPAKVLRVLASAEHSLGGQRVATAERNNGIPFVDLKVQYRDCREQIDQAIRSVCESTEFILGKPLKLFEERFAHYIGAKEAIGVANGTDALSLTAWAMGISQGDEVLLPANTFIATALAVYRLGAKPVPVDVDPSTFLIDLEDAEKRVTERSRMIIPVHLYGRCVNMDDLITFAHKHDLMVHRRRLPSTWSDLGGAAVRRPRICCSVQFFPRKEPRRIRGWRSNYDQ